MLVLVYSFKILLKLELTAVTFNAFFATFSIDLIFPLDSLFLTKEELCSVTI